MTIERVPLDDVDALIAAGDARRRQEHHRAAAGPCASCGRAPVGLIARWPADAWRRRRRSTACSPSTRRGCASSAASRRTRSPRTGATSAATPSYLRRHGEPDPGAVDEAIVAGYVDELRTRATTTAGPATRRRRSRARSPRCARSTGSASRRGLLGVGPERGRRRAACARRGSRRRSPRPRSTALLDAVPGDEPARAARPGDPRDALRAAACASASSWASTSATSTSTTASCACSGKGNKERVVPLGRTARDALGDYLTTRPPRARRVPAARADVGGVPQRARRAAHPPGRVADRAGRGGPGRARRPALPPRAAALVRHPHARPRRRHPGGAGAARPRQPLDHPGVHEGVARSGSGPSTTPPTPGPGTVAEPEARNAGQSAARQYTPRHGRDVRTRCCATSSQEERERLRDAAPRLGHGADASSTSTRTSPTPARSPPSGARSRRSPGSSARPSPTSRTRWPSSTPAPTASASRASSRIGEARLEAMPAARLCITCASQRR